MITEKQSQILHSLRYFCVLSVPNFRTFSCPSSFTNYPVSFFFSGWMSILGSEVCSCCDHFSCTGALILHLSSRCYTQCLEHILAGLPWPIVSTIPTDNQHIVQNNPRVLRREQPRAQELLFLCGTQSRMIWQPLDGCAQEQLVPTVPEGLTLTHSPLLSLETTLYVFEKCGHVLG